ncbi:MAG: ABC transporter permease subunit [Alphaproteobacteria bacterium]|nr:ABC transporter permease subunit [Alphaproteobacteria bacterium]
MLRFILSRICLLIPTFFGVTLLTFGMVRLLPGDPIEAMLGERAVDPRWHAEMLQRLGFDRRLWEQYGKYIWQVFHGDLGLSVVTNEPVMHEFLSRFPATVELALVAMLFGMIVGIPAGIIAAIRRGRTVDHTVMTAALTGQSMPIFWWGLLLILFFSLHLDLTPVSGRLDVQYFIEQKTGFLLLDCLLAGDYDAFFSALHHMILPTIALGTIPLAIIARMTRSSMIEVLNEDYIRTAKAKGLRPWRVIVIHALRNALIPVITVIGLQTGTLLAGAVLTETIFSWPGIGKWLINSLDRRDYPVLQGAVLLVATFVMLVNLTVDLLYGLINPRIRHAR